MSLSISSKTAKRIFVIGAGSSGLVAVKVITKTTLYKSGEWDIVAFEAGGDIGVFGELSSFELERNLTLSRLRFLTFLMPAYSAHDHVLITAMRTGYLHLQRM
jgi:cation diffusion facilitator CzcD-associated flavoprotein CzcO